MIVSSYNDALTPVYLWMVPLALGSFVLLLFVKENPLATHIDREATLESLEADSADATEPDMAVAALSRNDR